MLLALAATLAVFVRALSGDLVYDDLLLIQRNPLLADLSNLPQLLQSPYWDFLDPGARDQIGYWRPLSALAHAVAFHLGHATPLGFHVAGLLAHLGATWVSYLFVRRLLSGERPEIAGAAALLFGLHPVHVESVAWVSALNDPLFGLFTLLAATSYLAWRQRGSPGVALRPALWFLFAMLSKEMGIATLAVIPLIDFGFWLASPERRLSEWRRAVPRPVRAWLPLLVVLAVYLGCRVVVFQSPMAGFDRTPTHFGVGPGRIALLRFELLGGGLWLLGWPLHLNAFRPFRPDLTPFDPSLSGAWFATGLWLVLFVHSLRKGRAVEAVALLFIPLSFFPVLVNVGSLGRFPLSDRFLYVPVLGFTTFVAVLFGRLPARGLSSLALLAVGALYGVRSWTRIAIWRDEKTLFETAVRESPRSAYLQWGLGRVYLQRLASGGDPGELKKAFAAFGRAGDLLEEAKRPGSDLFVTSNDYLQTNLGLAQCYTVEAQKDPYGSYGTSIAILEDLARRVGELEDQTRKAREAGLRVIDLHHRLELVWAALGTAHRLAGDVEEADSAYRKALSLDPRCVEALMGLGRLNAEQGQWDVASRFFEKVLELAPSDFEAKLAYAQSLREGGRTDRAEELALELIDEEPTVPEPMLILAADRLAQRKPREALTWIDRALAADPDHGHAWYLKAMAMQSLGVNPQATLEAFQRACSLLPNHFEAFYNFATLLLNTGAAEAAVPYLIHAYELATDPVLIGRLFTVLAQLPIDSPDDDFRLAVADVKRGHPDVAESWLDRALELDPDHPASLVQKAHLLRSQERHGEALELLGRAAGLLPDSFGVHFEYALYLEDQGRLIDAQREFLHCLELPRPADWEEDAWADAARKIRKRLESIESQLPPSDAYGPPSEPTEGDS